MNGAPVTPKRCRRRRAPVHDWMIEEHQILDQIDADEIEEGEDE